MGGEKLVRFSKGKCRALQQGRNNPKCQHKSRANLLESSSVEKDLGVFMNDKMTVSQQSPCDLEG